MLKSKCSVDKYDEYRPITSTSSSSASSSSCDSEKNLKHSKPAHGEVTVQTVISTPDGGWGWVVCVSSFLCFVILDGMLFTYGVFYVEFLNYFGEGKGKTALVGSVLMGMSLFFGPFTSAMVNLWGLRCVSMAGAIIATVSFASSIFAPNLEVLTFTYGFMGGIGVSMVYIPSILVIGFYFDKKRALANGITSSGSGLGAFIFSPLSTYLIDTYTWKGAMLILSGIVLHCVLFCALYRPLKAIKIIANVEAADDAYKDHYRSSKALNEKYHDSFTTSSGKGMILPEMHLSISSELDIVEHKCRMWQNISPKPQTNDLLRSVQIKRHTEFLKNNLISHTPELNSIYIDDNFCKSQNFSDHISFENIPQKPYNSSINITLDKVSYEHQKSMPVYFREVALRPVDKADVYYSGSLHRLNSCSLHNDNQINPQLNTSSPENMKSAENQDPEANTNKGCNKKVLIATLNHLIGAHLLVNPVFWLTATAMCMWTTHSTILTILPHFSMQCGFGENQSANLLSFIGLANVITRLLVGWISSNDKINVAWINISALFIGGITCIFIPYSPQSVAIYTLAVIFGCCMATWTSLRPILMVEVLGLNNLTNAFGLVAMFQGFCFSIGPPIAGILSDVTASYTVPFCSAGSAFILSGLLFLILDKLKACLHSNK